MVELSVCDLDAYREVLDAEPGEWDRLDSLCRITISCFYRDRAVWDHIGQTLLPDLARLARGRGDSEVRCWSVGSRWSREVQTTTSC